MPAPRFQPRLVIDTLNLGEVGGCTTGAQCPHPVETDAGDLDVSHVPAGTSGYGDLASRAARFDLDGIVAPTAALLDVIHSKTAANRPKDQASLPVLEELARKLGFLR